MGIGSISSIGSYLLEYENGLSYYTFVPEQLSDLRVDSFDEETCSHLENAHRLYGHTIFWEIARKCRYRRNVYCYITSIVDDAF